MSTAYYRTTFFVAAVVSLAGCGVLSQGKSVVEANCRALSTPSGEISMGTMAALFGEKKVDEWCECAYHEVSRTYSDSQIANAPSAGALDPVARDLPKRIASATAMCMKDSKVPETATELRDSFVKILEVIAQ